MEEDVASTQWGLWTLPWSSLAPTSTVTARKLPLDLVQSPRRIWDDVIPLEALLDEQQTSSELFETSWRNFAWLRHCPVLLRTGFCGALRP